MDQQKFSTKMDTKTHSQLRNLNQHGMQAALQSNDPLPFNIKIAVLKNAAAAHKQASRNNTLEKEQKERKPNSEEPLGLQNVLLS